MNFSATANYIITDGYEETYSKNENGQKLTTGRFTIAYQGEMNGEGHLMELKNHLSIGEISVYGLERFIGEVNGYLGTFVLEYSGRYVDGQLQSVRKIVPGSGTDQLANIEGEIKFTFQNAIDTNLKLDYSLPFQGFDHTKDPEG
tara:strand:+ start:755 stop:1189 length:435 start_codon:yes stop_codon:yes gene_type:complete